MTQRTPAQQLSTTEIQDIYLTLKPPNWSITFTAENNDTIGKLEINDGQLQFTGNADEAGKIFFNSIGCEFDALRDENKRLQAKAEELEDPSWVQFIAGAEKWMLKYPPDVFDGSSGDKGPLFVVALREALAALKEDK